MKNIALLFAIALLFGASGFGAPAENPYAGKLFASGDVKKAEFALTFDDGPGYITEDLLKLLEKRGVKVAFFLLGSNVRAYPSRAAKVAAAGHLVCSHTDSHLFWPKVGKAPDREAVLRRELEESGATIEKATGVRPTVLRMPNGYDKPWVRQAAAKLGYTLVNWTYGSDWTKISEEKMLGEYLKALRPGAILLLHDGGGKAKEKNLRLVEAILAEAAKKNLKPVRLDDLLGLSAPAVR